MEEKEKKLIIVIGLVFILIILGFLVAFFVLKAKKAQKNQEQSLEQIQGLPKEHLPQQDLNQEEQKDKQKPKIETEEDLIESEENLFQDTDGDGLEDKEEINIYKTNPNDPDTDNDGIIDPIEIFVFKSDPLNPDSDNDGVNDKEEILQGLDPSLPGEAKLPPIEHTSE